MKIDAKRYLYRFHANFHLFMKTFLFCIALLFSGYFLSAQPQFAPPGAEWFLGYQYPGLVPARGYEHYRYIGDTVIQGQVSKIIRREDVRMPYTGPAIPFDTVVLPNYYCYQTGDSVMRWLGTTPKLMWRTNPLPGDTFYLGQYRMQVDSAQPVLLGSVMVNKIRVTGTIPNNLGGGTAIYFDKIGATNGLGLTACWGFYDCYTPTLCRYSDDFFPEYEFPNPVCGLVVDAETPLQEAAAKVFPNPFDDFLTVQWTAPGANEIEFQLINQWGVRVSRERLGFGDQHRVSLHGLPAGVYFYQITNGATRLTGRVLKSWN